MLTTLSPAPRRGEFPEEDDGFTPRGSSSTVGAWWFSLTALAFMLMTGAAVLG